MRLWRILVLAFILVLGVSVLAFADILQFFVTTDPAASTGDTAGFSVTDPRRATNLAEWNAAISFFATKLGSDDTATVFWYQVARNRTCEWTLYPDGTALPGRCPKGPPDTGVDLTPPLVVASLLLLAAALFGAGYILARRQQRAAGA